MLEGMRSNLHVHWRIHDVFNAFTEEFCEVAFQLLSSLALSAEIQGLKSSGSITLPRDYVPTAFSIKNIDSMH
jgi:hypothetical protein